jgi:hypothetical protein
MLDVVLIVCLVVFVVAWLVSNDWDFLMSLWKKSCVVFIIWEHVNVVFSFDALFGLTWRILTTCLTLKRCHKPLWSFGFWLVIPLHASVNHVSSLCMIMAIIALLVGRSQSFESLHFVLSMTSTRASNSQKPSFPMCPPYIPISNFLFQVYLTCFYLSFKLNFLCYMKISQ